MEIYQSTPEKHPVLGGKAYVYKREGSQFWQCATYLQGHNFRTTTKEQFMHEAIRYAEDWYNQASAQLNYESSFRHRYLETILV